MLGVQEYLPGLEGYLLVLSLSSPRRLQEQLGLEMQ